MVYDGLQVFQELGMWFLGFDGGEGGLGLRVIVEYNCSDWVLLRFRLIFKGLSLVVSVREDWMVGGTEFGWVGGRGSVISRLDLVCNALGVRRLRFWVG